MDPIIDIVTGGTRGLLHDARITGDVLCPLYKVNIHVSRRRNFHLLHRRLLKSIEDKTRSSKRILLFFENLPDGWMDLSGTKILIPNQEWMREGVIANIDRCDAIWCKTRYAERIFKDRNFNTTYIGFTSEDIYMPEVEKDYSKFIHIAGHSHLKGTESILDLWKKNPRWPPLLVVTSKGWWQRQYPLKNVIYRQTSLTDKELHVAMNTHGIHLCTSEAEGFGHHISEALSSKALVITTDAAPMNEIVLPKTGLLTKAHHYQNMGFGERFLVDQGDLEKQILQAIQMDTTEKKAISQLAREVFKQRQAEFYRRLIDAISLLV